ASFVKSIELHQRLPVRMSAVDADSELEKIIMVIKRWLIPTFLSGLIARRRERKSRFIGQRQLLRTDCAGLWRIRSSGMHRKSGNSRQSGTGWKSVVTGTSPMGMGPGLIRCVLERTVFE